MLLLQVVKELEPVLKQSLQQPTAVRLQGGSSLKAEHQLPRDGQLLLQLPHVHSLQQAKQQSDALQLQAYKKTRKLQGISMILTWCSCKCSLATHA